MSRKEFNIAILVWSHPFSAVEGPALLIANGMAELGWSAKIINISEKNKDQLIDSLNTLLTTDFDMILSITAIPLSLRIGDKYLSEYIQKPIAVLLVDSPIYLRDIDLQVINSLPGNSLILFVDAYQAHIFRNAFINGDKKSLKTDFFPFGATRFSESITKPQNFYIDHKEREFDLCVFATLDQQHNTNFSSSGDYSGAFNIPESNRFYSKISVLKELLSELINNDYGVNIYDLLKNNLGVGVLFSDPDGIELLQLFDSFLKRYRRFNLVKALIESCRVNSTKISIFGTGWNNFENLPETCTLFGPSAYLDQFNLFGNSRFLLNLDPNWSHGIHDRVFNGMSVGTPSLTNNNSYSNMYLKHDFDALLFDSKNEAVELFDQIASPSYNLMENLEYSLESNNFYWANRLSVIEKYINSVSS
jgi:hypothetical protein